MIKEIAETAIDVMSNEAVLNKSSSVLEMIFPYMGLKKKTVDMYLAEIEKSDMSLETKMFLTMNAKKTLKQIKNQAKIACIASENAKEGTDFSKNSGVSEEWLERFMDSAGYVSSEDIQLIWGKILATEFEEPGKTPPNMIRILSEMTPMYAKAFKTLCSMQVFLVYLNNYNESVNTRWEIVIPFTDNIQYMGELGITFELLGELESLGVIKFDSIAGYISTEINEKRILLFINGETSLISEHEEGIIPLGNVLLTSAGKALKKIISTEPVEGYCNVLRKYMETNNVKFAESTNYQVEVDGERYRIIDKTL